MAVIAMRTKADNVSNSVRRVLSLLRFCAINESDP